MIAPTTPSDPEIAEVRIDPVTHHRALFSCRNFNQEDVIAGFSARKTFTAPTYLTVQIGEHEHIELFPLYLECINHSCDPNCFFDTTNRQLIALRSVAVGEEMTFFYPSSEWDMDQAFKCNCGRPDCLGLIQGANYLSEGAIRIYRFTDFISQKLRIKQGSASITPQQRVL